MYRLQRATGDRHLFLLFILLSDDPGEKKNEGKKKTPRLFWRKESVEYFRLDFFVISFYPPLFLLLFYTSRFYIFLVGSWGGLSIAGMIYTGI